MQGNPDPSRGPNSLLSSQKRDQIPFLQQKKKYISLSLSLSLSRPSHLPLCFFLSPSLSLSISLSALIYLHLFLTSLSSLYTSLSLSLYLLYFLSLSLSLLFLSRSLSLSISISRSLSLSISLSLSLYISRSCLSLYIYIHTYIHTYIHIYIHTHLSRHVDNQREKRRNKWKICQGWLWLCTCLTPTKQRLEQPTKTKYSRKSRVKLWGPSWAFAWRVLPNCVSPFRSLRHQTLKCRKESETSSRGPGGPKSPKRTRKWFKKGAKESISWRTFWPRKKIFSPPPKFSNLLQTLPPLRPPSLETPPPHGIFNKKPSPLPPSASDFPFPSPVQKKIKNIETSTKILTRFRLRLGLFGPPEPREALRTDFGLLSPLWARESQKNLGFLNLQGYCEETICTDLFCTDFCTNVLHGFCAWTLCTLFFHNFYCADLCADCLHRGFCKEVCMDFWHGFLGVSQPLAGKRQI